MDNNFFKNFNTNSLVPFSPILFSVMLGQSNYQQKIISKEHETQIDIKDVFHQLPSQNITFEQNQIDVLVSFVSKLVNESKDLDGEIVDMVNKNFWDLI
ncbi:MAG: hypothetical protein EAZ20_07485 [Bacteroidetes bacterium]|nr:MAG: hypothetical protein EAZ20_07485 [Bacteroidota bacterium]